MDDLLLESVKHGKDVNQVLDMPYHFMIQLLSEDNEPEQANSFFDLL